MIEMKNSNEKQKRNEPEKKSGKIPICVSLFMETAISIVIFFNKEPRLKSV